MARKTSNLDSKIEPCICLCFLEIPHFFRLYVCANGQASWLIISHRVIQTSNRRLKYLLSHYCDFSLKDNSLIDKIKWMNEENKGRKKITRETDSRHMRVMRDSLITEKRRDPGRGGKSLIAGMI